MPTIQVIDVLDEPSFRSIPPCADPGFDHRTCDFWEDSARGSKAARPAWLDGPPPPPDRPRPVNPFAGPDDEPTLNPFAPAASPGAPFNPFAVDDGDRLADNPFAPQRERAARPAAGGPRKLGLLTRGLGIFGSYAKVLLVDGDAVAYSQFGPLSAYPRARRVRDLYPQLPEAPLPAVITCIATTPAGRASGHAARLVADVCDDLARRGFAAVEAYPELGTRPETTSAATPAFWVAAGFAVAVDDERFPVVRRELG